MYNTILNDIAKGNYQERLRVVKYDCKHGYFIATDGHILICEANKRLKNDKDLFFSPITSELIKYDCYFPDFNGLFSENKQHLDNFTNGAIYKSGCLYGRIKLKPYKHGVHNTRGCFNISRNKGFIPLSYQVGYLITEEASHKTTFKE